MTVKTNKVSKHITVSLDTTKLDQISQELLKKAYVEVGILGDKDARENGTVTNAFIGAVHEYGTTHIPRRSFLEDPLATKLPNEKAGMKRDLAKAFTKSESGEKFNLNAFLTRLGIRAEGIIQDAFRTGGFGQWPPSQKVEKYEAKKEISATPNAEGSPQTLIDTGQLMNSITSRVVGA